MPRERIYSYQKTPTSMPAPPETFVVEVAWQRDHGAVEVAATATDGTERAVRIVNDWLREADIDFQIDLAELQKRLAGKGGAAFDGYHVHLDDRADVNRLIRTLRRARDMAFGRDE